MAIEYEISEVSARAALVGLITGSGAGESEKSLDELERLLETAGGSAVIRLTQSRGAPDVRTVLGSGKISELAYLCSVNEINLVVFDLELSPSQIRNIEDIRRQGRVMGAMLTSTFYYAVTGEETSG